MSDLRPVGVPVELGGVERHFLFTLNAIDAIESHYGCTVFEALKKLTEQETQSEALRFFVTTLANDEAEREKWRDPDSGLRTITEKESGWLITLGNTRAVTTAIMMAYGISVPEPDDDDDPNQTGGQQSS